MPFENGEWYQCEVVGFEYIKSEKKQTPAFELTCRHPEHGEVVGQWWLTDTITGRDRVPMWQAAMGRCIKLGCSDEKLRATGWVEHARENVVGKTVAVCVEINQYGDAKAQFIGIPKGERAGFAKAEPGQESLFALKASAVKRDPFAIADDDVPL